MTPNELTDILAMEIGSVNDWAFKRSVLARANATRAQLMKRTLEKTPQDRSVFTQAITVDMENFNFIDGTGLECVQSRSVCDIPVPLRSNSIVFDYVGSVDGSHAYRETNIGMSQFLKAGRMGAKLIPYRYMDPRLYIEHPNVARVLIVGIFADPEEIYNLNAKLSACKDCDFWEARYPCSEDILDIIIKDIRESWRTRPVNQEVNGTQNKPDPAT